MLVGGHAVQLLDNVVSTFVLWRIYWDRKRKTRGRQVKRTVISRGTKSSKHSTSKMERSLHSPILILADLGDHQPIYTPN
jgi:hypothetical protein